MSIQLRRGQTNSWTAQNPVLLPGQVGVEFRSNKSPRLKIGNGSQQWSALRYAAPDTDIYSDTALNAPNGTYGITCSNFAPISANGGSVGALDRPYRSFIGWNLIYPNATTTKFG